MDSIVLCLQDDGDLNWAVLDAYVIPLISNGSLMDDEAVGRIIFNYAEIMNSLAVDRYEAMEYAEINEKQRNKED